MADKSENFIYIPQFEALVRFLEDADMSEGETISSSTDETMSGSDGSDYEMVDESTDDEEYAPDDDMDPDSSTE